MKARRITIAVIIVILLGGFIYMNPLLPIITGYAAKNLSSGIFVAERSQESLEANDLNFSFIKFVKNKVDYENKEVKSRFLWHSSTSVYNEGFGCTLVKDATVEELHSHLHSSTTVLPENPDTIAWPMGNLVVDTIPSGIDMDALKKTMDMAFADTIPFKGTFAAIVVYKGQIVAERFRNDFKPQNKFLSWSMAKSFTNALVGIMVKEGRIDINKPLDIQEWQHDDRKNITVNNLLHMNSGLEWNEDYGNNSDVNIMLHKVGDMGQYAIDKPYKYPVDSIWYYSSGTTNIVGLMMRKSFNSDNEYHRFPREKLFNKIGIRSAIFEPDASGTFVGSSYLYATMQDYARFGLLYLNDGNWLGEQILPEGWIKYSTTEANGSDGQYGAFFWLNLEGTDYPDVPKDMYSCNGHDGQFIYIIPSKDLVVVRTGFSKHGDFDNNEFLAEIVNAIN